MLVLYARYKHRPPIGTSTKNTDIDEHGPVDVHGEIGELEAVILNLA